MKYTKGVELNDTTLTTVLTVPSGHVAHVEYIFLENHSANDVDMDLLIEEGGTEIYLMDATELKSAEPTEFFRGVFVVQSGKKIKAQLSTAEDYVSIAVTFELLPAPNTIHSFD